MSNIVWVCSIVYVYILIRVTVELYRKLDEPDEPDEKKLSRTPEKPLIPLASKKRWIGAPRSYRELACKRARRSGYLIQDKFCDAGYFNLHSDIDTLLVLLGFFEEIEPLDVSEYIEYGSVFPEDLLPEKQLNR